jgi:HTH-type transcriptional regulator, glycine betaine synthesis regulator
VSPPAADEAARQRAIGLVAEAIGEIIGFWNFKPSMGRVWSVLYLSATALDAEQIELRTGLSAGMVSTTLNELLQWGVVRKELASGGRRRLFVAETDIWMLVARVFRDRELRMVGRSIEQLEAALHLLDHEGRGRDPRSMHQSRFLHTRISGILELARTGHRLIDRFSRTGSANLRPLRDVLAGARR